MSQECDADVSCVNASSFCSLDCSRVRVSALYIEIIEMSQECDADVSCEVPQGSAHIVVANLFKTQVSIPNFI